MKTTANSETRARLRLWLPGYHTPSLNVTAGKHWGKVRKLKQLAARELHEALRERKTEGDTNLEVRVTGEALRVLARLMLGLEVPKPGKRPPKPEWPARLRFERVTVSLLDEENFVGSTKGLTDCLRYAFPTMLRDDAPGYVVVEHVQTRCGTKCEQGTWVELAVGAAEFLTTET